MDETIQKKPKKRGRKPKNVLNQPTEKKKENSEKETEAEGTARQAGSPQTGRGEETCQEGDAGGIKTETTMGAK